MAAMTTEVDVVAEVHLFGLLHVQEGEVTSVNLAKGEFIEKIAVYARMAVNLGKSLKQRGIKFSVLTNEKVLLETILKAEIDVPEIIEIEFTTKVPSGIKFYSAHFKFDAFRYLSSRAEKYVGLCDLDMSCINDVPLCLKNLVGLQTPLYYDISDQVIPAYGHDVIIRDLEAIRQRKSEGRWAGGEFVSGAPEFFALLSAEVDRLYDAYVGILPTLHHVGDEAVTSAALENIRGRGIYVGDSGTLGIVGRYWSTPVLHVQQQFKYFERCFLIHLPADKAFLSRRSEGGSFTLDEFRRKYLSIRLMGSIRRIARRVLRP